MQILITTMQMNLDYMNYDNLINNFKKQPNEDGKRED